MTGTLLSQNGRITRAELAAIATPQATPTHRPVPHSEIVAALVETLAFRHIGVVRDEYAVSADGMKMFGVLDLEAGIVGVRFSIGIRNANDKSMRLAMTVGYRVLVCDNMAFVGDFMPVLHKHSKNLDLVELVSIGVDKIQRNFDPLRRQIEDWQERVLPDDRAKLILYAAFVEGQLEAPRQLLPAVHRNYFNPELEAFRPRTIWSLSNAFTSALKDLTPLRQFQVTGRVGAFLSGHDGR